VTVCLAGGLLTPGSPVRRAAVWRLGRAARVQVTDRAVDPVDGAVWLAGDIVAYRCEDCLDRWDLVLEDDDPDE